MIYQEYVFTKLKALNKPIVHTGAGFVMTTCLSPSHIDGHPSFSINLESLCGRCFSCGFKVNKSYFLDDVVDEEQAEEISRTLKYQQLLSGYRKEEEIKPVVYFPPNDGTVEAPWRGLTRNTLDSLGIYICQTGHFENRIIFPMQNVFGNDEAFNTRHLGEDRNKYKYSKGIKVNELLYPTPTPTTYLVLVEGIMDAISMVQDNIPAVFNFGVNETFGPKKIKKLLELGVETIYLAFDNDEAGAKGVERYLSGSLGDYFELKMGTECEDLKDFYASGEKDYNDYIQERL